MACWDKLAGLCSTCAVSFAALVAWWSHNPQYTVVAWHSAIADSEMASGCVCPAAANPY